MALSAVLWYANDIKCAMHFFEFAKISKRANKDDMTEMWLQLNNAETEEESEMLAQTGIEFIQKKEIDALKVEMDKAQAN